MRSSTQNRGRVFYSANNRPKSKSCYYLVLSSIRILFVAPARAIPLDRWYGRQHFNTSNTTKPHEKRSIAIEISPLGVAYMRVTKKHTTVHDGTRWQRVFFSAAFSSIEPVYAGLLKIRWQKIYKKNRSNILNRYYVEHDYADRCRSVSGRIRSC